MNSGQLTEADGISPFGQVLSDEITGSFRRLMKISRNYTFTIRRSAMSRVLERSSERGPALTGSTEIENLFGSAPIPLGPFLRKGSAVDLLTKHRDLFLTLYRFVIGLLFACHGAATLFNVLGGPQGQAPSFGQWPGWWAAVIELIGGALVLLGLGARAAAVICSGTMAYAYFVVHQPQALFPIENGGEKAALFCWGFLLIAVLGPGRWALSTLLTPSRALAEDRK